MSHIYRAWILPQRSVLWKILSVAKLESKFCLPLEVSLMKSQETDKMRWQPPLHTFLWWLVHLSFPKSPPLIKSTREQYLVLALTGEKLHQNRESISLHIRKAWFPGACVGKSSIKETEYAVEGLPAAIRSNGNQHTPARAPGILWPLSLIHSTNSVEYPPCTNQRDRHHTPKGAHSLGLGGGVGRKVTTRLLNNQLWGSQSKWDKKRPQKGRPHPDWGAGRWESLIHGGGAWADSWMMGRGYPDGHTKEGHSSRGTACANAQKLEEREAGIMGVLRNWKTCRVL